MPALLLVATLVGCSGTQLPSSASGGNRIVTPAAAPRAPTASPSAQDTPTASATAAPAVAHLRGTGMSASDLYTGYRAILDTYVDPVDGSVLIKAATDSLRKSLQNQVSLPLETLPVQLVAQPSGNTDHDWQDFGDAYQAVVSKLPDWANQSHPDWMVLRAMADSLKDGHTSFLTPDEVRRRNETTFAGIGVLLSRPQDDQPPLIAEIFPKSPASTSGLKRGDRIIGVDGQDVSGKTVGEIAQLIRGQSGTNVRVQVRRLNSPQPQEFTLKRAQVQVEPVTASQVPSAPIGYLRVRGFNDDSVADQVLSILDQGRQRNLRGWVVDLRGNPGGSLHAVLTVAGGFFDPSHTVVGYQVDRQRRETSMDTQPLNMTNGMAVILVVDRDSASGAEILAAALQEAKLATLVGSKTAGNVGVATQIVLPDTSVLQVTEQRFVSPGGVQIDGTGVTPDVPVEMTDEDLQNDRDPQLARALQLMIEKITAAPAAAPSSGG